MKSVLPAGTPVRVVSGAYAGLIGSVICQGEPTSSGLLPAPVSAFYTVLVHVDDTSFEAYLHQSEIEVISDAAVCLV